MAKTKKSVQPSIIEDTFKKINGGFKSPLNDKPAKNLKKPMKAREAREPWTKSEAADMIKNALKSLSKGSLVKIRKHIMVTYNGGKKLGKDRQDVISDALRNHFDNGRIRMTNSDSKKINFIMQFAWVEEGAK